MAHGDAEIPAAGSTSDPALLERVQDQMKTTFGTWKLLMANDPVGPQTDAGITSKAMENVLGKPTTALCWTAGRDRDQKRDV